MNSDVAFEIVNLAVSLILALTVDLFLIEHQQNAERDHKQRPGDSEYRSSADFEFGQALGDSQADSYECIAHCSDCIRPITSM